MLIRFLPRGDGSAKDAIEYVLADTDHLGRPRTEVTVLRGDPHRVVELADSLDRKWKYFSGVIAFAPEDWPTPEQIEEVLDAWQRVAFTGLDESRFVWTAIKHRDPDGSVHVHVLGVRVDLATGRDYNPAPPGHKRFYGPLQDFYNLKYNRADPNSPERRRLVRGTDLDQIREAVRRRAEEAARDEDLKKRYAGRLRQALKHEPDPRNVLNEHALSLAVAGLVKNRQELAAAFREAGLEITRMGKNYMTVMDPETRQRYRLRGLIYGEEFDHDPETVLKRIEEKYAAGPGSEPERAPEGAERGDRGDLDRRVEEARARLEEVIRRRDEQNRKRYGPDSPDFAPGDGLSDQTGPENVNSALFVDRRNSGEPDPSELSGMEALGPAPTLSGEKGENRERDSHGLSTRGGSLSVGKRQDSRNSAQEVSHVPEDSIRIGNAPSPVPADLDRKARERDQELASIRRELEESRRAVEQAARDLDARGRDLAARLRNRVRFPYEELRFQDPRPLLDYVEIVYQDRGDYLIFRAPWREDRNPSVVWHRKGTTGGQWLFVDHGDRRFRGDHVNFLECLGYSRQEAKQILADLYGLSPSQQPSPVPRPQPRPQPSQPRSKPQEPHRKYKVVGAWPLVRIREAPPEGQRLLRHYMREWQRNRGLSWQDLRDLAYLVRLRSESGQEIWKLGFKNIRGRLRTPRPSPARGLPKDVASP